MMITLGELSPAQFERLMPMVEIFAIGVPLGLFAIAGAIAWRKR